MKECFYHLNTYPDLPKKYVDEGLAAQFVMRGPPSYNVCRAETSFITSNFALGLYKQYGPVGPVMNIAYYKNPAKTGFAWHVDRKRTCAINILLTDSPNALTMHRQPIDDLFFDIEPVIYRKYRPILFDTKTDHAVYNPDNSDRIILTIGFIGPSYQEVKEFLVNMLPPNPETW